MTYMTVSTDQHIKLEANRKLESDTNLCFTMLTVDNDDTKLQSRNTTTTTRGGAENTYHGRSMTEIVSLVKAHYHARAFDDGVSRKRL